jgi:hypothetical protein
MSHLPEPVRKQLKVAVDALDEGLQERSRLVSAAMKLDIGFDERYVSSVLTRSLLCAVLRESPDLDIEEKSNGGCELHIRHAGVAHHFRWRKAGRNKRNGLVVTANSDSALTTRVRAQTMGEQHAPKVVTDEQWVIAYFLHPAEYTLTEAWAARPVGLIGDSPPYRYELADVTEIRIGAETAPPPFAGADEDLDLGDEGEAGEDEGRQIS